ncbi:MAG TPA: hypothetical protein VLV78_03500 [Thermoanaerobaculia bacterium]|nr:hypothetical protein [Thermoanaerobaculia bacterium]
MPTALLLLALVSSFPSNSKTSWMTPQAFRLIIGMPRADAVKALLDSGWSVKPGRNNDEVVIDYADDKSLTLEFHGERLRSIRFELFAILPEIRNAFTEQKEFLRKEHGAPKSTVKSSSIVLYDDRLPNIMVVLSADPKSDYGKKGVGYLAVRYYDPVK